MRKRYWIQTAALNLSMVMRMLVVNPRPYGDSLESSTKTAFVHDFL